MTKTKRRWLHAEYIQTVGVKKFISYDRRIVAGTRREKQSSNLIFNRNMSIQMVRLNIAKRHSSAETKSVENIDLDEKIRRIREANKERERRFKEIEQDKKLAAALMLGKKESCKENIQADFKSKQQKIMKGVQADNYKITTKGRGRKLLDMSHHHLKAEHFESRTKDQWKIVDQNFPQEITLKNNCRSSIRERIKTKSTDCGVTVPAVENEELKMSDVISTADDKLYCIPENQSNEPPEVLLQQNTEGNNITKQFNDTHLQDDIEEITEEDSHKEHTEVNIAPSETNTQTDQVSDSVKKQETIKETTTKKEKPKIKVVLKKTASTSSFDESMAMLSPLDVPLNWGDADFSDDDEQPAVSIWKN